MFLIYVITSRSYRSALVYFRDSYKHFAPPEQKLAP
jgi:hypothetical protein